MKSIYRILSTSGMGCAQSLNTGFRSLESIDSSPQASPRDTTRPNDAIYDYLLELGRESQNQKLTSVVHELATSDSLFTDAPRLRQVIEILRPYTSHPGYLSHVASTIEIPGSENAFCTSLETVIITNPHFMPWECCSHLPEVVQLYEIIHNDCRAAHGSDYGKIIMIAIQMKKFNGFIRWMLCRTLRVEICTLSGIDALKIFKLLYRGGYPDEIVQSLLRIIVKLAPRVGTPDCSVTTADWHDWLLFLVSIDYVRYVDMNFTLAECLAALNPTQRADVIRKMRPTGPTTSSAAAMPIPANPDECNICLTQGPRAALVPCGHVFCRSCADSFRVCPVCRATVADRMNVYL